MATVEDVVTQLIARTESGKVEWAPFSWKDDGTPVGWSAKEAGCYFSVIADPITLSVSAPPQVKSLTEVGRGEQISCLVEVLQTRFGERTATREEALSVAYDSLTKHHNR